MLIKTLKSSSTNKVDKTEKSIYSNFLNTIGYNKYKSSVLLTLYNHCKYKKINNLSQLNSDYNKSLIKFITFHFEELTKNSIIFSNKKRSLFSSIKNNK